MKRLALLALLLGACASEKGHKGLSRHDAKQFLDTLAETALWSPEQQPSGLARACADIPLCADGCGLALQDYAALDEDSRAPALLRSCDEASSAVLGNAAAFGPEGPTPDAIARGAADFVRQRAGAFADRARAVLPVRDQRLLDHVRVSLAL